MSRIQVAMGTMKNYLLRLLQNCSEEQFGQDAIEWAITTGLIHLSYQLDTDARAIMSRYDEIIEAYRESRSRSTEESLPPPAPMERAVPRRRAKADVASRSKRRSAA